MTVYSRLADIVLTATVTTGLILLAHRISRHDCRQVSSSKVPAGAQSAALLSPRGLPARLPDKPTARGTPAYALTPATIALISATLTSIGSAEATLMFYDILFTKNPELRKLFGDLQSQQQKFAAMWQWMTKTIVASPMAFSKSLRSLGDRHVGYNVRLDHIPSVKTAFLEMIKARGQEVLTDDQQLADVNRAWEGLLYVFVGEMGPRLLMHENLQSFHDALCNDLAAPAGGTSVALAGAQGASLLAMAAALTRAPQAGSVERATIDKAHEQLLKVRAALEELAGLDMAAYCRVMAAVRQPVLANAAARKSAIGEALEQAARVPLQAAEWTVCGLHIARALVPIAAKRGVGDAGAGALLLAAACKTAIQNVSINTESKLVAECSWPALLNSRAQLLSCEVVQLEEGIAAAVVARHVQA